MKKELKPCPFCGGEAIQKSEIFMSGVRYYQHARCKNHRCCAGKIWHDLDQWNTRYTDKTSGS